MLKVVVDTNLFVRAMLKGKTALPLIKAWKKKRFELATENTENTEKIKDFL